MIKNIDELKFVNDWTLQQIVRNVGSVELLYAISDESEDLKAKIFFNMSVGRISDLISELVMRLKLDEDEKSVCKEVILANINRMHLDRSAFIREDQKPRLKDIEDKLKSEVFQKRKKIEDLNLNDNKDLAALFVILQSEVNFSGILSLENYLDDISDLLIKRIFRLIIDGNPFEVIRAHLSMLGKKKILSEKKRLEIIKMGLLAIAQAEYHCQTKEMLRIMCEDEI